MAVLVALGIVLAFYTWTSFSTARTFPSQIDYQGRDYFNLLTDAFLRGQVSLPVEPRPELLALENPYDPTKNYLAHRVHDFSLYEGKYYLYWGPTPVLTLFGPARLLLGRDLPERVAVVGYAFGGLIFSLLLLRWLVRRYLSDTPPWMLWFAGAAVATSNIPFLLRRPTVYEVAVSAGFCLLMAAIYLLLTGAVAERPSWPRLIAGSACLGLAIGARLSMGAAVVLNLAVLVYLWRRGEPRGRLRGLRAAAALLGPVALSAALLLVYNKLRFGSFTEFGQRYQLNDVNPYLRGGLFDVPHGLYYYLLAPPRLNLDFPFFHLPPPPEYPGTTPRGYTVEAVGGLLSTSPIVVMAAALPVALRAAEARARELGAVVLGLVAVGGAILLALCLAIYGAAMRYATDFTTVLVVAGLAMWMFLRCSMAPPFRHLVTVGGALLIVYGAAVGIAISFTGTTDGLRAGNPALFESLERAASPLPTAAVMLHGEPVITAVSSPTGTSMKITYRTVTVGAVTFGVGRAPAVVEIISPDNRDAVLRAVISQAPPAGEAQLVLAGSSPRPTLTPVPRAPGPVYLPVRLERGRNRIELRLEGAPDPAALVVVRSLRLVGPGQ